MQAMRAMGMHGMKNGMGIQTTHRMGAPNTHTTATPKSSSMKMK